MDGANCVGSVSDWSLSAKSLDNTKLLDATVSEVMDAPFPIVETGAARGRRGEVAVEIESRGPRPLERQRAGNRDSIGHVELPDGAMSGRPVRPPQDRRVDGRHVVGARRVAGQRNSNCRGAAVSADTTVSAVDPARGPISAEEQRALGARRCRARGAAVAGSAAADGARGAPPAGVATCRVAATPTSSFSGFTAASGKTGRFRPCWS